MTQPFRLVFFIFMVITVPGFSQTWEIGASAGGMGYMGDLNQTNVFKITDLAVGGMVKRNFDGYWSLKFSMLSGKVRSDDAQSSFQQERDRNLNFYTPITEASLMVEFNFFDYGLDFGQKRITPFLFTGFSYFGFNPKAQLNDQEFELKYYNTEGQTESEAYKTIVSAIPFGAGLKVRLTDYINVAGELGYRSAKTDYLDDVSGLYPLINPDGSQKTADRIALSDPSVAKIGVPGTQRGDFRKKDTYLFVGITLSYTFVRQNCPF